MSSIIQVNNLSKSFTISHEGSERYMTLRDAMTRRAKKLFSFPKSLGVKNNPAKEEFWALKDVTFNVLQGDRVGIIGRNGAGKSTLLKILSRITEPTTGSIKIKGRVASLLEVGTGFHPELTGRENIFLNGAILGMSRAEIKKHFDAIVDFAEIEKFLDTPVKRYSSGMYVRLAFAVAAHLEPEILVVDEVLAVGDAQFQKKCLGKMEDVSMNEGRTVLFVSHNMNALNSLCNKAIFLKAGEIIKNGSASDVINHYLSVGTDITTNRKWDIDNLPGDDAVKLIGAKLIDDTGKNIDVMDFYKGGGIEFTYEIIKDGFKPIPNLHLFNQKGDCVFIGSEGADFELTHKGVYSSVVYIPPYLLNDGRYIAGIATSTMIPERIHFFEKEALIFDVIEDMNLRESEYRGPIPGVVRPKLKWRTKKINP